MRQGARRGPDGRFLNPDGRAAGHSLRDVWTMLREGGGSPWPRRVEDPPQPPPAEPPPGHAAVTFIGHATFLIRIAGGPTVLTDPIWSERCSPLPFLGPRRARAPGLALDALPQLDAVLLSHNHYDHLDIPTLRRLRAPRVVTGLGNSSILTRNGLPEAEELDWWQETRIGAATVTYLPARHFSARGIRDRGRSLWGGFAVRTEAGSLFFAGDTAYGGHFSEIGAALGPFGIGLIPIGAYEPEWFMRAVHMNPEEALRGARGGGGADRRRHAFRDLSPDPGRYRRACRDAGTVERCGGAFHPGISGAPLRGKRWSSRWRRRTEGLARSAIVRSSTAPSTARGRPRRRRKGFPFHPRRASSAIPA